MGDENDFKLKLISEYFIKPNCEIEQSKNPYYLTANDLFHLSTSYMHRGLLYAKPPTFSSDDVTSLVNKLKHSMSIALVDFYPLAGRLATVKYEGEDDQSSWVYVDCNKGPGARLIHATDTKLRASDVIVSSCEGMSRRICSLFDLSEDLIVVNHDGHTRPLLSVQVTELVDGVFIGFAMNHSLGDGTSLWYFIKTLSKIFMDQGGDIEKPIFKAVFPDGYGPVIKLPYFDPNGFNAHLDVDPRLTLRVFHFTAASIARLKAQANHENSNGTTISSFKALSAFMWLSVTRARNIPLESDSGCWIIANTRPKHDPPLASNHFGNFIWGVIVKSKVKELKINGLGWAAMMVHQAVLGLDNKVISDSAKAHTRSPAVAQVSFLNSQEDNPPLFFVGSMRFDAYGPEFGLGKAIATRPGSCTWVNGRIVVDPGREGGGSADLQVCLLSETMTALESDVEFMSYIS